MGRRTYIPKMGPKKPVKRPVNYVKSRPPFERMLKEWKARHEEYYREFKERVETGFINDDPKVIDEFSKLFAVMPFLQNKNSDELLKAFTPSKGKSYEDYEWDEKKEAINISGVSSLPPIVSNCNTGIFIFMDCALCKSL